MKKNNLAEGNPELAKQWHPTLNGDLTPRDFTCGSGKKVWWLCGKGHYWDTAICARTRGSGCPYCFNKKVLPGYNDLATINPELAAEWHPQKNNTLTSKDITAGSNKRVWWECKRGHEWEAMISQRNNGSGCKQCNLETQTSFPEQAIYYYLKQRLPVQVESRAFIFGVEVDIYIPEWDVGIEYDGLYFHNSAESMSRERKKNSLLAEHGIQLIRIKESVDGLGLCPNVIYCVPNKGYRYLNPTLNTLIEMLSKMKAISIPLDVNIERDSIKIREQYIENEKHNSIAFQNPNLAREWHPVKNGRIKPEQIYSNSGQKFWWQCTKHQEHEWEALVYARNNGTGCPYCAGRKVLPGYNDLVTTNPELEKEWHPTLNSNLTPEKVTVSSGKKVWWQCDKKHEWKTTISSRSQGSGCPFCYGRHAIEGETDLATVNPALAKEWHPTLNGEATPTCFTSGSTKKVWWQCNKHQDHQWEAIVGNRNIGLGCPYCSNRKVLPSYNDLATTNPKLAREWHPTLNGNLTPFNVFAGSSKKVWWQCDKHNEHYWKSAIGGRNSKKKCPYCSNRKILIGYNDLATTNPDLAKEWHTNKNGGLTPALVTGGSNKIVWWQCDKKHEWSAMVNSRNSGCGCPYCSGLYTVKGETDFATTHPHLAEEWHPNLNGDLTPSSISAGSSKKVWWYCTQNHEWQARVESRKKGIGRCPECAKLAKQNAKNR